MYWLPNRNVLVQHGAGTVVAIQRHFRQIVQVNRNRIDSLRAGKSTDHFTSRVIITSVDFTVRAGQ